MITVMFSCNECGLVKEKVHVRYRCDDENIVEYVEKEIGEAVALHHSIISPDCKAKTIQSLMIPCDKDQRIGIGMKP